MQHSPIFPPLLRPNDPIAIVATGGKLAPQALDQGLEILKQWPLQPLPSPTLFNASGYFAGTDNQRLAQLQEMLDAPNLKAIYCARGGYGTTRLLDRLDFTAFRKHPKWIIGFSDITALHLHLHRMGFASIHGPTLNTLQNIAASDALQQFLFEGKMPDLEADTQPNNRLGTATGQLIGGNLCMLAHSLGSASECSFDGKILFLEEIGESPYKVDRYLNQLQRGGKLAKLGGLIIGDMGLKTEELESFGTSLHEIVLEKLKNRNIPVAFGFPIGHIPENSPVVCGAQVQLAINAQKATLSIL